MLQDGPPAAFARLAALYPTPSPAPAVLSRGPAPAGGSASASQRTFVLLKPTAVKRALVAEISKRFERRGFSLVAMKMLKPGAELASKHYAPSKNNGDYRALVSALAPGPAVAMVWQGAGAVQAVLELIGDDDPAVALPGSVRGDLSLEAAAELVECAPTEAAAKTLAGLWFTPAELGATHAALVAASSTTIRDFTAPRPMTPPKAAAAAAGAKAGKQRFYITTAINYANGPPHMGHAYEGVCADVIARYHRAYGRDVFFLTGADEHGQKIADTAAAAGVQPIELCDKHVAMFKALNERLGVSNDFYVRTTSARHKAAAQALWRKAAAKGEIYLHYYKGWYNVREETFVTDQEAEASNYLDPISGKPLQEMEEPSYFFRLSKYHAQLEAPAAWSKCPRSQQPANRSAQGDPHYSGRPSGPRLAPSPRGCGEEAGAALVPAQSRRLCCFGLSRRTSTRTPSSSSPPPGATRSASGCATTHCETSPSHEPPSRGASPCPTTPSTSCTSGSTR